MGLTLQSTLPSMVLCQVWPQSGVNVRGLGFGKEGSYSKVAWRSLTEFPRWEILLNWGKQAAEKSNCQWNKIFNMPSADYNTEKAWYTSTYKLLMEAFTKEKPLWTAGLGGSRSFWNRTNIRNSKRRYSQWTIIFLYQYCMQRQAWPEWRGVMTWKSSWLLCSRLWTWFNLNLRLSGIPLSCLLWKRNYKRALLKTLTRITKGFILVK